MRGRGAAEARRRKRRRESGEVGFMVRVLEAWSEGKSMSLPDMVSRKPASTTMSVVEIYFDETLKSTVLPNNEYRRG